ncbi:DNA photolyase, partial [Thermodesulfobacteriota bacterium]
MKDPSTYLKNILIENSCAELPYTQEILARAKGLPVEVIPEGTQPVINTLPYPDSLSSGKKTLFLTRNRGNFLKPCPGTKEYNCCGYHIL